MKALASLTLLMVSACNTSLPGDPLPTGSDRPLPQVGTYLYEGPAGETFPRRLKVTAASKNTMSYWIHRLDGTVVVQDGRAGADEHGRYHLAEYREPTVGYITFHSDYTINASLLRTVSGYDCQVTVWTTDWFCVFAPCQPKSTSPPCTFKYEGP